MIKVMTAIGALEKNHETQCSLQNGSSLLVISAPTAESGCDGAIDSMVLEISR
jgi:hypothetical protein